MRAAQLAGDNDIDRFTDHFLARVPKNCCGDFVDELNRAVCICGYQHQFRRVGEAHHCFADKLAAPELELMHGKGRQAFEYGAAFD